MSTSVFFIGGWHAKPNHIAAWVRSAQQKKPGVAFTGFPWPGDVTSWPPEDIVQGWKDAKQYRPVLDAIKACTANTIYIVGHSSGCAVSNAVDNEFNDPKGSCSWRSTVFPRAMTNSVGRKHRSGRPSPGTR